MRAHSLVLAIFLFCTMASTLWAEPGHRILKDGRGNVYHSWLQLSTDEGKSVFQLRSSRSYDGGENFLPAAKIISFTREVAAYDISFVSSKIYLAYNYSQEASIYYAFSRDNGQTFSTPLLVSANGSNPSIASSDDLIALAWEENGAILLASSESGHLNPESTQTFQITAEALSFPSILLSQTDSIYLVCRSTDEKRWTDRLIFKDFSADNHRILLETSDRIISPRINLLDSILTLFWQQQTLQGKTFSWCTSLNQGKNFGKVNMSNIADPVLALSKKGNKLFAFTNTSSIRMEELALPPISPPQINSPNNNGSINSSCLIFNIRKTSVNPLLVNLAFSKDNLFSPPHTYYYRQIATSENTEIKPTENFEEGTYYAKAWLSDGFTESAPSVSLTSGRAGGQAGGETIKFRIDNIPPAISSLEVEKKKQELLFKGFLSENPVWLKINAGTATLETAPRFEIKTPIRKEGIAYTFFASDEAGNSSIFTQEVYINSASAEISITSPPSASWFKAGTVVFIEAEVSNLQAGVDENEGVEISIDSIVLKDLLTYDPEERKMSGFISLPNSLENGRHALSLRLKDLKGNVSSANLHINIDNSPPTPTQGSGEACFTNSFKSFTLPIIDADSGLDPYATLIKINGISTEAAPSIEGSSCSVYLKTAVLFSSSEIEVVPRDLAGNIGKIISFSLIVDTTPPKATLHGSSESISDKGTLPINLEITEEHPNTVKITDNNKIFGLLPFSGNNFRCEVPLVPGDNTIVLDVSDRAGNVSTIKVNAYANISASQDIIQSIKNAPNPFSPANVLPGGQGKGMLFAYSLNSSANIKIYIFDITGTLIWETSRNGTSSGNIIWDGITLFGQTAQNGVYPYLFTATDGDKVETKRGKIILLN